MKELLIMAKSLGGGGSEVALIELINALPEELYNITLVLLDSDNEYAYRLKKNVNIVQLTFNSSFAKSLVSMYAFPAKVLKKLSVNSFIAYYDFISNCVTNVFEKTYDIAIDFYGYGSFVTAFLATKIHAKKKATWLHDEKPYWMKSVQKYLCEYDKIYGVSQAVVDAFCREYPHYKDKAAVFYNVIDIEEIKRKSEQDEIIPFKESFSIVTVGRLTEQKGYDIAIKAASILKKRKINFAWYAIGGGRDEKKLKKLVEKYCLENQFVFLGRKKNPYPYMRQAQFFCLLSEFEGYGMVIEEAKILNKPIIITDTAAREAVQNYENSIIVNNNEEAIYAEIKEVLQKKIKSFSNKQEKYDNSKIITKLEKLLEEEVKTLEI
jgi:glycosyltransferase involved in cell wall biosynthesis